VRRKGFRKPEAMTFAKAADSLFATERVSRSWKPGRRRSTAIGQTTCLVTSGARSSRSVSGTASSTGIGRCASRPNRSPASVNCRLTVLRMGLAWAKKKELRQDLPELEYARRSASARERHSSPSRCGRFCGHSTTSKRVRCSLRSSRPGSARPSSGRFAGGTSTDREPSPR
jgi:hypothetical protein